MDYTMNNQSLEELIKRDKKLGRPSSKGAKQSKLGKRPNKIQQQRAQVQQAKAGGAKSQQARQQARQPQKLGSRHSGIAKRQPAANAKGQKASKPQQRNLKGASGATQGRLVGKGKKGSQQVGGNSRQAIAAQRRQKLLQAKLAKRSPQAQQQGKTSANQTKSKPVVKQQAPPVVPQGTLAQRKLKVRNIDASNVTVADVQKLFSKCGALVSAGFDTNMHGQYLGSATVIFVKAVAAQAAIKQYNGAQIDERVIKVEYALPQDVPKAVPAKRPQAPVKPIVKQPLKVQRAGNAIKKRDAQPTGRRSAKASTGKTLRLNPEGGRRGAKAGYGKARGPGRQNNKIRR